MAARITEKIFQNLLCLIISLSLLSLVSLSSHLD
jgi:hypothetical protein